MDLHYLEGRLEHAKALEADIVKVDIEEYSSAIKELHENTRLQAQIYEKDQLIQKLEAELRFFKARIEEMISDINNNNW